MRPILELIRLEENELFGTFGVLRINKQTFCVTLEPPDIINKVNISSIPAQQYICKRYHSKRYPDTFEVTNVPDRSSILFHPGNTNKNTAGCILLAASFGKLSGNRAILNSGHTFALFLNILEGVEELHLTIREVY